MNSVFRFALLHTLPAKSSCTHNDWSIYFYHDALPYRVAIWRIYSRQLLKSIESSFRNINILTSTRSFLNQNIAAKKEMAPIGAISFFVAIFLCCKSAFKTWVIYAFNCKRCQTRHTLRSLHKVLFIYLLFIKS